MPVALPSPFRERERRPSRPVVHFRSALEFLAPRLASMLDSLVRVTRRAGGCHFANDLSDPKETALDDPTERLPWFYPGETPLEPASRTTSPAAREREPPTVFRDPFRLRSERLYDPKNRPKPTPRAPPLRPPGPKSRPTLARDLPRSPERKPDPLERERFPAPRPPRPNPPLPKRTKSLGHWQAPLSLRRFQVLFTLFSECFSPFLRSTSALSVSPEYLALDGINHPC